VLALGLDDDQHRPQQLPRRALREERHAVTSDWGRHDDLGRLLRPISLIRSRHISELVC
jgi:hypothetical protein